MKINRTASVLLPTLLLALAGTARAAGLPEFNAAIDRAALKTAAAALSNVAGEKAASPQEKYESAYEDLLESTLCYERNITKTTTFAIHGMEEYEALLKQLPACEPPAIRPIDYGQHMLLGVLFQHDDYCFASPHTSKVEVDYAAHEVIATVHPNWIDIQACDMGRGYSTIHWTIIPRKSYWDSAAKQYKPYAVKFQIED